MDIITNLQKLIKERDELKTEKENKLKTPIYTRKAIKRYYNKMMSDDELKKQYYKRNEKYYEKNKETILASSRERVLCPYCNKEFNKAYLIQHKKRKHKKELSIKKDD